MHSNGDNSCVNSDPNEQMKLLASATNQVPAFFAAERVIGPAWPACWRGMADDRGC